MNTESGGSGEEPGKELGLAQQEARTCPVCGTKFYATCWLNHMIRSPYTEKLSLCSSLVGASTSRFISPKGLGCGA